MSRQNDFLLLPCEKEDFLTISSKGYFCFPPTDPTESDDPVSLDSFFCNAIGDEGVDHYFRTYKLVSKGQEKEILVLASISNSSMAFETYEDQPQSIRNSGFNDAFPAVMLVAFGVKFDCHRKGLGTIAFNKLLELIRSQSIAGVRLLTLKPLPSAVPFYQSLDCQPLYAADDDTEVESMYLDLWDS